MNTKLQSLGLLFLLMLSTTMQGQKSTHHFRDIKLEERGGVLSVEFRLPLHKKSVGSVESAFLLPVLEGEGHRLELPYIRLDGKSRCKALKRTGIQESYLTGMTTQSYITYEFPQAMGSIVDYRMEIPYEDWMEHASLMIHEEVYGCAGKREGILHALYRPQQEQTIVQRKKTADALVRVSYVTPRPEEKQRAELGSAYLDFPQGQSVIQPEFRHNYRELRTIEETIEKTRKDRNLEILGVTITGYASPEGSYQLNERLSWERAQALRSYLQRNSNLSSRLFDVLPGGGRLAHPPGNDRRESSAGS